jgi:hypothetical protein
MGAFKQFMNVLKSYILGNVVALVRVYVLNWVCNEVYALPYKK